MHAELPKGERFNGSVVFESKISPCYARNKVELFDELGNSFIWNRNANNAKLKVDERYNDIVDDSVLHSFPSSSRNSSFTTIVFIDDKLDVFKMFREPYLNNRIHDTLVDR